LFDAAPTFEGIDHQKCRYGWTIGTGEKDQEPRFEGSVKDDPPEVNEGAEEYPGSHVSKDEIAKKWMLSNESPEDAPVSL